MSDKEQPMTSLTQQDLTKWEELARNIASELAIGYDAQVLTVIETGLAQAYKAGQEQPMTCRYEASQVDATTWMVRRWDEQERMTESLLRDLKPDIEREKVIELAVWRGSWA